MNDIPHTDNELKTTFASSCIESVARRMGCSATEIYLQLKKTGLLENYIWEFYDTLHTQSREHVTDDIIRALEVRKNSEKE